MTQYWVFAASEMAKDSFAQSRGSEALHFVFIFRGDAVDQIRRGICDVRPDRVPHKAGIPRCVQVSRALRH